MIVLEIHRPGAEEVQVFTSDKRTVTLGRHSTNDIRLEEDSVSRFHAEIENREGRYFVRDLDSRNGLYVNNMPILEHGLAEGDEIRVGGTKVVFHAQQMRPSHDSSVTQVVCLFPASKSEGREGATSIEGMQDMPLPGRLVESLAEALDDEKSRLDRTRRALQDQALIGLELGHLIASTSDVDDLLKDTLVLLARRVRFSRGVILTWDEDTRTFKPRAIYQDAGTDPDRTPIEAVPVSMTIINQCLERQQGICCVDAMSDPRFASSDSIFDLRLRSVICVPLRGRERDLGVIQVDSPNARDGVKESDLGTLMLAGNLLAEALEAGLALEQRAKRERRGDEARVLAAAVHCLHSVSLMTGDQIKLLREAAETGEAQLMTKAVTEFSEAQSTLSDIIEGLLDYLRGRVQTCTTVQINDLLGGLLDELAPTFEVNGIEVEFLRDPNLREGVFDPAALRLLFLNLLINAVEALQKVDRPLIHVTTEQAGAGKVSVRIQDNGSGMDFDSRNRIFTPFYTTKGRGHAGLGLTYARHIAAAHDGRIECESEPELGTTFIVRFPLRTEPPAPKPAGGAEIATASPWLLEG